MTCELQDLNIVANKLAITLDHEHEAGFPAEVLTLFSRHLGTLGIFASFLPDCLVQELISTALANRNLEVLDLRKAYDYGG